MPVHLAGPAHDLVELRAGRGRLYAIEIVLEDLAEIPARLIQASFIRGGLEPAAALEACMIEPSPTTGTLGRAYGSWSGPASVEARAAVSLGLLEHEEKVSPLRHRLIGEPTRWPSFPEAGRRPAPRT